MKVEVVFVVDVGERFAELVKVEETEQEESGSGWYGQEDSESAEHGRQHVEGGANGFHNGG